MDYGKWVTGLSAVFTRLWERVGELLPTLIGALALLLVGWVLARLLRTWTGWLISHLDRLAASRLVRDALRRGGVERPVAEAIGATIFWLVLLLFVTAATETLGLPVLTTWLGGLAQYLPRVLVAVLIVIAGLLAGSLARSAVATAAAGAGTAYPELLGRGAQGVILLVAGVTAVDQLGVDSRFLTATLTVIVGAGVAGIALAFGFGARTTVGNILASHYLRQTYEVGHRVRIGAVEGRIVEITPTSVILEGPEGRVLVPAKEFSEAVSVLVIRAG